MRKEKPTRRMDGPLPPVRGFDWTALAAHVERVDEMLTTARRLQRPFFEVECIPEELVTHVAEVFIDRGCEVLKGRNRLKVVVHV